MGCELDKFDSDGCQGPGEWRRLDQRQAHSYFSLRIDKAQINAFSHSRKIVFIERVDGCCSTTCSVRICTSQPTAGHVQKLMQTNRPGCASKAERRANAWPLAIADRTILHFRGEQSQWSRVRSSALFAECSEWEMQDHQCDAVGWRLLLLALEIRCSECAYALKSSSPCKACLFSLFSLNQRTQL